MNHAVLKDQWWKKATIYQVYPKSFKDSNDDGIGDIQGIISKIAYFKKLGVDGLWLTPIYPSPQKDNGYDIKDYTNIDPIYGTLDDFKKLVEELHKENIKIILDIVVNHTSTEHPWFLEAKKSKDSPYRDYYIWKNKANNWISKFGGSAWEYNEKTNDYYLHLFDKTQADLNWENKKVIEEVINIMKFWLGYGVDGFRLDVINLISKDQSYLDDKEGDGRRYYTDGAKVHQYLKILNREVFSKYNIMTVGEMSSTTIANCIKYSNEKERELDMVFNFHHLKLDYKNGNKWQIQEPNFKSLKELLTEWQEGMQEGEGFSALFWGNHDQPRIVSRYGLDNNEENINNSAKMLALVLYGLRGTVYIFQGDEIGTTNPKWNNINEFKDIESLNYYNILLKKGLQEKEALEIISLRSRDNSRVPISWNGNNNAGFSNSSSWIKNATNYQEINVENSLSDKNSIFYFYQKLIKLKKEEKLIDMGKFQALESSNINIFSYERASMENKLVIIANLKSIKQEFTIPNYNNSFKRINNCKILISNYPDSSEYKSVIKLRAFEAIMYKIDF